jgi:hypothetical protein
MAIKLNIEKRDQQQVKQIGGRVLPDGKTWVIPDEIKDINPFMQWMPCVEGHIVQKPYFSVRATCLCWKCKQETPVVALGAKSYQALTYETEDNPLWQRIEDDRLIYTEIDYLDKGISAMMQANYPFFQQQYSSKLEGRVWGNRCVHCQALQEEDDEYAYGLASPFSPISLEAAKEIRVVHFKLEFDYYIRAGSAWCDLYLDVIT